MFERSIGPLVAMLSMGLVGACSKTPRVEAEASSPSSPPASSPASSSAPSSERAPPVVPTRDVCTLVTKEEVKQATGLDVRKLEPSRTDAFDGCEFRDVMGRSDFVAVFRTRIAFEQRQREDETALEAKAEPLAGVGDDAWLIVGKQMGFPSVVVGVRKPNASFLVAGTTTGGEAETKALRKGLVDLAKLIAKRI